MYPKDVKRLNIPYLPLNVQQEIADILDSFTGLIESLEREIDATRTLYAVKRDQIIQETLREYGATHFPDVAKFSIGLSYRKDQEVERDGVEEYKDIPVLRANNIELASNSLKFEDIVRIKKDTDLKEGKILRKDDILVCAGSGSKNHIGKVAYSYEDTEYVIGGFMGVVRTTDKILPRFMFHILTSKLFRDFLDDEIEATTINHISIKLINRFQVPLPSLDVQEQIVEELDSLFNALEDKEEELKLRKKQYSYALDRLFDFPRFN